MTSRLSTLSLFVRRKGVLSTVVLAGLLGGCGAGSPNAAPPPKTSAASSSSTSSEPSSTAPSPSPTAATSGESGTSIIAADSEFGTILFDGTGQAIYLFDVETSSKPACYDACATAWPPVLTDGGPVAGAGVQPGLLGTTKRADGKDQVTYRGHPLYLYAHEGKHEVKCHDVFLNGGNWYAVQPDGLPAPPT